MTVPARLSVVTVGARDVAALRAFYERLGWQSTSPTGEFAAFALGGAVLGLYDASELAREAGGAPVPEPVPFKGFSLAINVEERERVDAAFTEALAAGATSVAEPVDHDWGGRSAYFADPEGNAWEIAWVPNSSFDERGALIWPD